MRRIVIAGLLLGVACGGGMETDVRTRSGPTQFAGKNAVFFMYDAWVTGIAVDLADGGVNTSGPLAITALELYVQDAPWSCWLSDAGSPPADVAQVIFDMYRPKPAPFSTGDYALGGTARPDGGDWSIGIYLDWHPECLAQDSHLTGGKVTLSSLTEEEAQGWMFVSLDDGTQLEGDFVARRCPAMFTPPPDGGYPAPLPRCGS